ncbi:MAG: restriction endonuclease subunit S [Candidatus Thiodiazotropha lotti]|nr:restriction endonuclease subunit S [Candidatus Thiodiazotropha lotti]MCG8001898.1 restriction endonuclease subunit S [Candidatus Thiodiazotropha lotti]MCG8009666.1 restriction endonuclease subunit S [Candidatus Thiodiazotropha lotti]MCW4185516.1 restriction endonuclease subunit S [Candidatus Thiodiazotropha lotti]MCW4197259.1 restriction endonuclease subunit S [Candidatus Thiodiazotropha lotti]
MVPEGWKATEIDSLAILKSGGTPSKRNSAYWGGSHPWVSAKDLKTHFISNSIDTLTDAGFLAAKIAPQGAVLVLVRGMTLLKDFPVGIATRDIAFNQDIKALIAKPGVDSLFLLYLLASNKNGIRQLVNTAGHGTGRLDTEQLKAYPVNIPAVNEQTKIAQILSIWDKAIETTEKLIENSKAQKKALMQKLLTGKRRIPGFRKKWREVSIKDMGKVVSGGTPDTSNPDYWDGEILWTTPTDITALKTNYISDTKRKITQKGLKESSAILLPVGALLVCTRATIGYSAIAQKRITTNQGFKSLIPDQEFDSDFIYYLTQHFKHEFVRYACGSTFLELSKKDFEKRTFFVPEKQEQLRISGVLNCAANEIYKLSASLDLLRTQKKALMQQLLTGKRRVKIKNPKAAKSVA